MKIIRNYLLFITGLSFMAMGINLIINSLLGTSPISSVPYVLSLNTSLSLGQVTFSINMICFLGQWLILRKRFESSQILQIPMTLVFAILIDLFTKILSYITIPDLYIIKLIVLLSGCLSIGIGITCQLLGKVVMLPGEGIINAIAINWHFDFGKTKVTFDCSLVAIACILSLYYTNSIEGIREGTIISALLTGIIVNFFMSTITKLRHTF